MVATKVKKDCRKQHYNKSVNGLTSATKQGTECRRLLTFIVFIDVLLIQYCHDTDAV